MFAKQQLLCLFVAALALTAVSTDLSASHPGTKPSGNNSIRLLATMRAGATKGKAKYEQINNNTRRKFSFELEVGVPGQTIQVKAGGNNMGSAVVNSLGRAKFELDTRLGQRVPTLAAGSSIVVTANGVGLMNGTLQ